MDTSQTNKKDKELASASDGLCQSTDVTDLKFQLFAKANSTQSRI